MCKLYFLNQSILEWRREQDSIKNKFVFLRDEWNDYQYITSFDVVYNKIEIGSVKIYNEKLDNLEYFMEKSKKTTFSLVEKNIDVEKLDKTFCSIGVDKKYYRNL